MSFYPCCRDATALLTEDAEGALEGVAKVKFALHLSLCTPCQRMRSQLRTTTAVLRELGASPPDPPPASTVDAIMALLAAPPSPPPEEDDDD